MISIYYQHEGEEIENTYARFRNERTERLKKEYEEQQKEKQLEERLYKRIMDQIMRNISVQVKNEASPVIQQLKNELNSIVK